MRTCHTRLVDSFQLHERQPMLLLKYTFYRGNQRSIEHCQRIIKSGMLRNPNRPLRRNVRLKLTQLFSQKKAKLFHNKLRMFRKID